jgi:hypothetical protein
MLKCIGRTAVAAAVALTLGRLVSPAAAAEDRIYTAVPVPAEVTASEVTVLWRDIGIYRTSGPLRMAGPLYQVRSYQTKAECEAAQRTAMATEALSRVGSTTEQLSDGIKTWDSDHQHYTTFRYLCRLAGTGLR